MVEGGHLGVERVVAEVVVVVVLRLGADFVAEFEIGRASCRERV